MLTSWNDGPAKTAILDFVERGDDAGAGVRAQPRTGSPRSTTTARCGSSSRCRRSSTSCSASGREEIEADPSLAEQQPYKAIIEKDPAFFEGVATQDPEVVATLARGVRSLLGRHHAGRVRRAGPRLAGDGEAAEARRALHRAGLPADAGALRPAEGERVPGLRVLRRWPRLHAGLRRGHLGDLQGERHRHRPPSTPTPTARSSAPRSSSAAWTSGPGKPEHIFAQTGRLPVFAGGNADVDIEMLESRQFALLVNHDDAEREFAYTSGAEASLAKAEELGWTVVSMKNDWNTVFEDGADHERPDRHRHPHQPGRRRPSSAPDAGQRPDARRASRPASPWTPPTSRTSPRSSATCAPPTSTMSTPPIEETLAATDTAALSYHGRGDQPRRDWGVARPRTRRHPRRAQPAGARTSRPPCSPPSPRSPGPAAPPPRSSRDPGEEISQSTLDWVEGYVPDQIGRPLHRPHHRRLRHRRRPRGPSRPSPLTPSTSTPLSLAVYQLGNNGTARTLLKTWPLGTAP